MVPAVSARYDPVDKVLMGLAGPGWPILVRAFPLTGTVDRHTIAGPQGAYGLDSSILQLDLDDREWMEAPDPDGNLIRIEFLQGHQIRLPIVRLP